MPSKKKIFFSVSMNSLSLQLMPISPCSLYVAPMKREPSSSEVVIMSPAALSSPGRGDISASVFPHSTGSSSFDHFHDPLLDPFRTAHNLWTAGSQYPGSGLTSTEWHVSLSATNGPAYAPQDRFVFVAATAQGWLTCRQDHLNQSSFLVLESDSH